LGIGGSTITDANLLNIQGSSASVNIGVVFNDTNTSKIFGIQNGGSALKFFDYTASAERMRIDSSGRVGIGTSVPAVKLDVNGDGLQIRVDGTANTSRGIMLRNTGTAEGQIQTDGNLHFIQEDANRYMRFSTANTERMRISSAGHTMFATTDDAPGAGNTQSGVAIRGGSDNRSFFSASSNYAMHLNRNTNDGEILYFAKDGTAVGSIGTNAATMYVSAPQAGGMKYSYYNSTNAVMLPVTTAGANADATHDLGYGSSRFRDLYLSGGVYLGGTNAWNKLDDYEEGTWTPTLSGAVVTVAAGRYTKVGNLVQFQARLDWSSGGGTHQVGGLPFTVPAGSGQHHSMSVVPYVNSGFGSIPTGKGWIVGYCDSGTTHITFTWQPNSSSAGTAASGQIYIEGTYQV
jgi:hypothetical protein